MVCTHRHKRSLTRVCVRACVCVCILEAVTQLYTAASLSCGPARFSNTCTLSLVLTHLHISKGRTNTLEVDTRFPAHSQTHSACRAISTVSIRDMGLSALHIWLPSVSGEKEPLVSLMFESSSRFLSSFPLSTDYKRMLGGWLGYSCRALVRQTQLLLPHPHTYW